MAGPTLRFPITRHYIADVKRFAYRFNLRLEIRNRNGDFDSLPFRLDTGVLSVLQRTLVRPLLPALEQVGLAQDDRLVFVPDGVLNSLPLHALEIVAGERLGDRFEIAYSHSLSMLLQCIRRDPPEPTNLFALTDPTNSLAGPGLEAELARRYFPQSHPACGVNHELILRQGYEAHVFYWMGHSQFWLRVPNWSGLQLAKSGEHSKDSRGRGRFHCPIAPMHRRPCRRAKRNDAAATRSDSLVR